MKSQVKPETSIYYDSAELKIKSFLSNKEVEHWDSIFTPRFLVQIPQMQSPQPLDYIGHTLFS